MQPQPMGHAFALGLTMSVYSINKLCRQALHDPALREALKSDPAGTVASWPLTDDERRALLEGDIAWLYEHGVHPFLMSYLTRWELFGLSVRAYSERVRLAQDAR
jgi:hypothetical protein